jgi:aldehyde:ferredoxin oxidoreductase
MVHGWAGKILYVDLNTRTRSTHSTMQYVPTYIGGRSMASRIALDGIPGSVDAFDADNLIIITNGPLSGSLAPTSGRTVMSSISPRTYPKPWYTHSTLGGFWGPELKYAGFDGIVITGKAEHPTYLEISDDDVKLKDAPELWNLDARATQLALKHKLGEKTQVLAIGPAGENQVRFASVQHSEENAAGHSGFGAVWGSKKLKAIAVRGTQGVSVAHPDELLREVLNAGVARKTPAIAVVFEGEKVLLREEPSSVAEISSQEGCHRSDLFYRRPACSQACTFNCIIGAYERSKDGRLIPAQCIGGVWRHGTFMRCTAYSGGGIEIPPSTNFSLDEEISLHELCNSLGLDLWFRLVMQPWFIRCRQLGVHKIRGHELEPENVAWFRGFMIDLAYRQGLGEIFAEDLRRAMDELEGELPEELIRLGRELEFNFGFPAHREGRFWDEQPLPFWVISAMMHIGSSRDPTIGTHQSSLLHAEFFLANRELSRRQFEHLSEKVFGYNDAFEPNFKNKAPVAIWSQNQNILVDSLPLCDFAFPQLVRPMSSRAEWESTQDISGDIDFGRRLLEAVTGMEISQRDLTLIGERAFNIERILMARAGRSRVMEEGLAPHFELPCRADGTLISREGFLKLMDEYYSARGWDLDLGWPSSETLKRLGLEELVPELDRLRQSMQQ